MRSHIGTACVRPSVVKQRLSSRAHGRLPEMQIAPPASSAGGAIGSLPHSVRLAIRLRDAPLLRVACNGGGLVFTSADLSALTLDPQAPRRDATCGREARGRTRARPAEAGRAEISEWDVDSRFHNVSRGTPSVERSMWFMSDQRRPSARSGVLARPHHRPMGHLQMQSRASMVSRPCGERSRWQLRTTGGEVP